MLQLSQEPAAQEPSGSTRHAQDLECAALERRLVRLTLTDGSVVERDLSALLDGTGVFERISIDDAAFRAVYVDGGTLAWPGEVDIAPETLIWDGPDPKYLARRPAPFLRPRRPRSR